MFKENCLPIFRVLVIMIIEVLGNKAMQVIFSKLLNSEKKTINGIVQYVIHTYNNRHRNVRRKS